MYQARNTKIAEDGAIDTSMFATATTDPDEAMEFFNVNYAPYLKTTRIEKVLNGVGAAFPDGSGLYLSKRTDQTSWMCFLVNYKEIKGLPNEAFDCSNGKTAFSFASISVYPSTSTCNGKNREELVTLCANGGAGLRCCAVLLIMDGWEIKEDYPW
jgi:hypothetical protein